MSVLLGSGQRRDVFILLLKMIRHLQDKLGHRFGDGNMKGGEDSLWQEPCEQLQDRAEHVCEDSLPICLALQLPELPERWKVPNYTEHLVYSIRQ